MSRPMTADEALARAALRDAIDETVWKQDWSAETAERLLRERGYEVRPIPVDGICDIVVSFHPKDGGHPCDNWRPIALAAEAADREAADGYEAPEPPSAAADPPALWQHSNLPPEDDRYCVDCAADLDVEALRIREGWPTPISMRRAADALDVLVIPRFGAILRWVADLCDNDPAAHAAAREAAK